MTSREPFARSGRGSPLGDPRFARDEAASNLPLYATAIACVLTTLGILWLRADPTPQPQFSQVPPAEEPVSALMIDRPQLTTVPDIEPVEVVTRAAQPASNGPVTLLRASDAPVSQQLRRPIRLVGTDHRVHDLRGLTAEALAGFGHQVGQTDALHNLLVTTLSEGQSDAYIDAALNAARIRGEFQTPKALLTVAGKIDTKALLTSLLVISQGAQTHVPSANADHVLSSGDSLAGLALRYYGEPMAFAAIAEANAPLARGMSVALSGARIEIPAL